MVSLRALAALLLATTSAFADEPTGTFQVGAGYSSDDGFIAAARIAQSDLFHTGTALSMDARVSQIGSRFGIDYVIPKLGDTGLDLGFNLSATRRDYPGFTGDGEGGAITLGHRIDRATRIFTRYRIEDVQVAPDPSLFAARSTTRGIEAGDHRLAWLGTGVSYTTLDGAIPLHG